MSRPAPLASFAVRPRFVEVVPQTLRACRQALLDSLAAEPPDQFEIKPFAELIGIHIAAKRRRYWSPRLQLHLSSATEGGTAVEGVYGPEIEVWSVFVYGYLATGMLGTFSAIYGGAQIFIEQRPWAFCVTGAMAAIAALLYAAAQLGQKLAAHQTFQLHEACTRALRHARADSAPPAPGA